MVAIAWLQILFAGHVGASQDLQCVHGAQGRVEHSNAVLAGGPIGWGLDIRLKAETWVHYSIPPGNTDNVSKVYVYYGKQMDLWTIFDQGPYHFYKGQQKIGSVAKGRHGQRSQNQKLILFDIRDFFDEIEGRPSLNFRQMRARGGLSISINIRPNARGKTHKKDADPKRVVISNVCVLWRRHSPTAEASR